MTTEQQEQAALYVLGALPPDERRAFEEVLRGNADITQFVRQLARTVDHLAVSIPQTKPPAHLRDKVLSRIEQLAGARNLSAATVPLPATPGFEFHAAADPSGWKQLPVRGAWIKLLSVEKERGYAVLLGRLEAGVRYPPHTHVGAEDLYILTGDLHVGDRTLGPGDFHHSDSGTAHGVNYSKDGCTLLAVLSLDHELSRFAMG